MVGEVPILEILVPVVAEMEVPVYVVGMNGMVAAN
jgi:hypothetical protein